MLLRLVDFIALWRRGGCRCVLGARAARAAVQPVHGMGERARGPGSGPACTAERLFNQWVCTHCTEAGSASDMEEWEESGEQAQSSPAGGGAVQPRLSGRTRHKTRRAQTYGGHMLAATPHQADGVPRTPRRTPYCTSRLPTRSTLPGITGLARPPSIASLNSGDGRRGASPPVARKQRGAGGAPLLARADPDASTGAAVHTHTTRARSTQDARLLTVGARPTPCVSFEGALAGKRHVGPD